MVLAALTSLTMANSGQKEPGKDPSKEPSCGAPFCKQAGARARAKASVLAENEAKMAAIAMPPATSYVAGSKASSLAD
jgi:hypothetical protein